MNQFILLFCAAASFLQASVFYTSESRSPITLELPFDHKGEGRVKAQIKNFNPRKTTNFLAKIFATGQKVVGPHAAFAMVPIMCRANYLFPMLHGKTQLPKQKYNDYEKDPLLESDDEFNDKWETVKKYKGKHAFEYHHRGIHKDFSAFDAKFGKVAKDHEKYHEETCQKFIGFHFDFSDQGSKSFKKLKAKLPFFWSGYELDWWLVAGDQEIHIENPSSASTSIYDGKYSTVDLLPLLPEGQKTFSLKAHFSMKKYIEKATDVDMITVEYRLK